MNALWRTVIGRPYLQTGFRVCAVRMPLHMRDGNLLLRPFTIFDGPFLTAMFQKEATAVLRGGGSPSLRSWFSFWWRLKGIFRIAYCITCNRRRTGFIGLYDLRPGESARMGLAIFDEHLRRRGYGRRAVSLVAGNLRRHRVVDSLMVEVETGNCGSLLFWQKLGFTVDPAVGDKIRLSLSLSENS